MVYTLFVHMPRVNSLKLISILKKRTAFTLVELMVVVAVIGVLASIAVFNIPGIQKSARDSQRLSDLRQLQTILERVKASEEIYPLSNESYEVKDHAWGSLWNEYNYRVPKDPLPSQKYVYVSDGQSYQLYAKFENPSAAQAFACASVCGPDGTYNGGVAGGASSTLISWETSPGPDGTGTSTGGVGGGNGSSSGEPVYPIAQGEQSYAVDGAGKPQLVSVFIDPHDPLVGATQTVRATLKNSSPVTSVTAAIQTDNGLRTFPLERTSGADTDGVWSSSWITADTHNQTYVITIRATDAAGSSDKYDITIR